MKLLPPSLLVCLLLACQSADEPALIDGPDEGATVSGHVVGGADKFLTLQYSPRLRGNLNPDGYRTQGTRLEADGNFSFTVDKVTDGGMYSLLLEDGWLHFVLFAGDELTLTLDPNHQDAALVATGRGAGKINFQRLDQLEYDYGPVMAAETPEVFAARADSIIHAQRQVLEAVYAGDPESEVVTGAPNRSVLERIISETPLTEQEYSYLDQLLRYNRYGLTHSWLQHMAQRPEKRELAIDFGSPAFAPFDSRAYPELTNMNDFRVANGVDAVLSVEQLKDAAARGDSDVTYGNWFNHIWDGPRDWQLNYLEENFSNRVYQSYVGSNTSWYMTMGKDLPIYRERLGPEEAGPYGDRLAEFGRLLERGTRLEAGFEADSLSLDKPELRGLLDRHAGKRLVVNFWSATFAGSSIVDKIPLMQDFERQNAQDLTVINICVDSLRQKGLWAARIMDNDWDANHYFVPIEGNDDLLKAFSDRNLATFCEGGASYAYIDEAGQIYRDIESPFHKLAEGIAREAEQQPTVTPSP